MFVRLLIVQLLVICLLIVRWLAVLLLIAAVILIIRGPLISLICRLLSAVSVSRILLLIVVGGLFFSRFSSVSAKFSLLLQL